MSNTISRLPHGYTNRTWIDETGCVHKKYLGRNSELRRQVEVDCIRGLAAYLPMPLLRAVGSDEIVLDAITGQNGYDLINTDRAADILFAAGRLLRKLHEVSTGAVPTLPGEGRVIVHGDFGPHNMLFDSTGSVTAILDWERARLGSPEDDMGWAELSIRIYQPPETAHSLKWFFEGYGIRPPWMVRREFMVRLCEMMREIDPIDRMGAASDLWAQRARTVSTWTQLPDD